MMAIDARNELMRAASVRYRKAVKKEKGQILDEVCANSGLTRKHAIRLLRNPPKPRSKGSRSRAKIYGELELAALQRLWPVSGYLSARRLVAALANLIDACARHGEWVPDEKIKNKLLSMSASTCDRLLKPLRRTNPERGLSLTRRGEHLKAQVAVRIGTDWDDAIPGFVEADLVAHCGPTSEGTFLNTLNLTDIATGWTEPVGLKGKGRIETVNGVGLAERRLPFKLKGIDTDNGSEFINYHLQTFCLERGICFTRSRPYVKNDGCHVEQKNGAIVRKHVGYRRLETEEDLRKLKDLYGILRLLVNFFEPSAKLTRTKTEEGKTKKVYDTPKTPYQRVTESEHVDPESKSKLRETYLALNPVALRRQLLVIKRELMEEDLKRPFLGLETDE
jgi:hypothetical protein